MLYYPFIERDTRKAMNQKAFKRFSQPLQCCNKVLEQNQFCPDSMKFIIKVGKLGRFNGGASEC